MKGLLLFCIIFSCSINTNAQESTSPASKRFGFQAGISTAAMNFNQGSPPPVAHTGLSWKTGFTFGFLLRVPLAKNLVLQPEYAFTQRNGEDKSSGKSYTLNYFSLPVLLNYRISPVFSIIAGPQVEILISAQAIANGEKTNITHDVEERSIGLTAGLEAQLKKRFFFSSRYFQGLNHIGIGQRSDVKEFKYEEVTATAGIRF